MKKRWYKKYSQLIKPIILFLILILIGTNYYHFVEDWSYLDSLYFTIITATTVGYGDFTPKTIEGKVFTIIFAFLVISFAFYFFSLIGKYFFIK